MGTPISPLQAPLDENSCKELPFLDRKSVAVSWVVGDVSAKPDDLKLLGVIFVEEGDGHSHKAVASVAE